MFFSDYFDPRYIAKQQTWSRTVMPGVTYKHIIATPVVIYEESIDSSLPDRGANNIEYIIDYECESKRLMPLSPSDHRRPLRYLFKRGQLITFRLYGLDPINIHGYFSPEENSPPEPIEYNPVWMKTPWITSLEKMTRASRIEFPRNYQSSSTSNEWHIAQRVVAVKHPYFDLYDKWFRIKRHSKYHKEESFTEEPKTHQVPASGSCAILQSNKTAADKTNSKHRKASEGHEEERPPKKPKTHQTSASGNGVALTSVKTTADKGGPKRKKATEDHEEERPPKKTKTCQCDFSGIDSPLGHLLKNYGEPGPKPIAPGYAHMRLCMNWRQYEYYVQFPDYMKKPKETSEEMEENAVGKTNPEDQSGDKQ